MEPNLSPNPERHTEPQSITLQPSRNFKDVPEIPQENLEAVTKSKTRKENDYCCAPYAADDDMFCLFRCLAWCCVEIGRSFENCGEGCTDCIKSCCKWQENGHNQDGCLCDGCFKGCKNCCRCDDCGGDWDEGDNRDVWDGEADLGRTGVRRGGDDGVGEFDGDGSSDWGAGDDGGGEYDVGGGDDWGGSDDRGGGYDIGGENDGGGGSDWGGCGDRVGGDYGGGEYDRGVCSDWGAGDDRGGGDYGGGGSDWGGGCDYSGGGGCDGGFDTY